MPAKPKATPQLNLLKRPRQATSHELRQPSLEFGTMNEVLNDNEHDDWMDEWVKLPVSKKPTSSYQSDDFQPGQTRDTTAQKVQDSPPTQPRTAQEAFADRADDNDMMCGDFKPFGRAHEGSSCYDAGRLAGSSCYDASNGISAIAFPPYASVSTGSGKGRSLEEGDTCRPLGLEANASGAQQGSFAASTSSSLYESLFAGF